MVWSRSTTTSARLLSLLALAVTALPGSPAGAPPPVAPPHELSGAARSAAVSTASVPASVAASAGRVIPGHYTVVYQHARRFAAGPGARLRTKATASYPSLGAVAAALDPAEVRALRRDPSVAQVVPDRVVTEQDLQTDAPWGLDRLDQPDLPLDRTYGYDNRAGTGAGAGATVYVVDSGISPGSADLSGRIRSGFSAINDGRGTNDCRGHGTHVAGTVAGRVYGVAKLATVVPVRVLDCTGAGSTSTVLAGLDWVRREVTAPGAKPLAVVNMSLGGGADAALDAAVAGLTAADVVTVVAAGNSAADACSFSPASEPTAVTVGASDATDAQAPFSNDGSCVDLYAPGVSITSDYIGSPTATATMSGTSMAAPHVAGAVALLRAANPDLTAVAVQKRLLDRAARGRLSGLGAGSPNLILQTEPPRTPPTLAPIRPGDVTRDGSTLAVTLRAVAGSSPVVGYAMAWTTDGKAPAFDTPQQVGNRFTATLPDGRYTVWAVAFDRAGNVSAPVSLPYLLDSVAPVVDDVITAVTGLNTYSLTPMASDTTAVKGVQVTWTASASGPDAAAATSPVLPNATPVTNPRLPDGDAYAYIRAVDGSGNVSPWTRVGPLRSPMTVRPTAVVLQSRCDDAARGTFAYDARRMFLRCSGAVNDDTLRWRRLG